MAFGTSVIVLFPAERDNSVFLRSWLEPVGLAWNLIIVAKEQLEL